MIARKATYLCGALVLAQAGGAGADTTLEERIVVLEERMDGCLLYTSPSPRDRG